MARLSEARIGRLAENAPVLAVNGKTPFLLDDPRSLWLVVAGRLDIFFTPRIQGATRGPRIFLFSALPGDLILGHREASGPDGDALQAVGLPGSEAARLPLGTCCEACRADAELAEALKDHLTRLGRCLGESGVNPPKATLSPSPGLHAAVGLGDVPRPDAGVVFARLLEGGATYCDFGEIGPESGPVPLTPHTWLLCAGPGRIEALSLDDLAAAGHLEKVLVGHMDMVLAGLALEARVTAVDVYNAMRRKVWADRQARRASLASLAKGLGGRVPPGEAAGESGPLLAACRAVAEALGHHPSDTARMSLAPTAVVADAAERLGLRSRRVRLDDDWWRNDQGPLVGFLKTGAPVALLPGRSGRYRVLNPAGGETFRPTAATADRIARRAYSLSIPLPDRPISGREMLRLALGGTRREIAGIVVGGLLMGLFSLAAPLAVGVVFGDVIPGADLSLLAQICVLLGTCALAGLMVEMARNVALQRFVAKVDLRLEPALWDRITRLPAAFFRTESPGALANRAESLWLTRHYLAGAVLTGAFSSIFVVVNFALMVFYDPTLAVLAMLPLLAGAGLLVALNEAQRRFWEDFAETKGRANGLVAQLLSGLAKLRLSGGEASAFASWARLRARTARAAMGGYFWYNVAGVFVASFPLFGTLVVFILVTGLSGRGIDDPGSFLAFLAAYGLVQGAMLQLSRAATDIGRVAPIFRRLSPILAATPESRRGCLDPGRLDGRVEAVGLTFRYDPAGPLILDNVDFLAKPGEFVALVGPSGSGKSTLLRLLLGFESPETGSIYYDNQDLKDFDLPAFRRGNIGVVLQNGALFPGDIRSNIAGAREASLEEVMEAARAAGLAEDLASLPLGLATAVGAGVGTLSGGQKQRIMIARALAGKPGILLLDEATSALDNRSQDIVSRSLRALGVTRVVAAHRLSTIREADRIYYLEAGRVLESGTYAELMDMGGRFAAMARRQT